MTSRTSGVSFAITPHVVSDANAGQDRTQLSTQDREEILFALNKAFSGFPAKRATERQPQKPVDVPTPPKAENRSKGDKLLVVKLPDELIRFEGGQPISTWRISGGKPGHRTPKGSFNIFNKDIDHTSSSYGKCGTRSVGPNGASKCRSGEKYKGADMAHYLQFLPSIGLHAGNTNGQSHGCIRVDPNNAKELFKWTPIGTPVIVCEGAACDPILDAGGEQSNKVKKP